MEQVLRRFVIQRKFGELPKCLDIYQDICRNGIGDLATVLYLLDFLCFPACRKSAGSYCHHPLLCGLVCANPG